MKIKTIIILINCLILIGCSTENHYHDGNYEGGFSIFNVTWEINGNEILINNSITGTSKLQCKQYPDRIEYEEKDGTTKILYAQENGDLKMSDLVIFKKVKTQNKEEIIIETTNNNTTTTKNQTKNFDLSKDSYSNESAIIKDIIIVENEVYIVVDIIKVEYTEDMNFEIKNENTKLRTYKVVSDVLIKDSKCMESTTSKYLIDNKERIKSPTLDFGLITTNNKGELTEINLGCWN